MGLFNFKKNNIIYAPFKGKCLPLKEVDDGVFSMEMLGKGVAFRFDDEFVNSPCFGEVIMVAHTKHAVGIRMKNGAEILVHVGLDTVELNGRGLKVFVNEGDIVRPGDQLIMVNREYMKEKNVDMTTMLVITNSDKYEFSFENYGEMKNKKELFEITKKE